LVADTDAGSGAALGAESITSISDVVERLLSESGAPVEALFVLGTDPAYQAPGLFARAIERIPLVVSFASLADDTALMADWILPQPHYLERWDLFNAAPGTVFSLASLARPVLEEPLCDVRAPAEVFLDIARREGGEFAEVLDYKDLGALIRAEVKSIAASRRGSVMGTAFDEDLAELMDRSGWWAPRYRSARELWDQMQETGGWWDPIYDHGDFQRVLHRSGGRFEFRPDLLSELAPSITPSMDVPSEGAGLGEGDVALRLFEPLPIAGARGSELPFLQAILDPALEENWDSWVEIHPETAALLGIRNQDQVELQSRHGKATLRARVTERVVPGLAALPVGLGRRGGGRWTAGRGANAFELVSSLPTTLSDRGKDERVQVRLALVDEPGRQRERRT
jgi:anaerobic selenocysteine-containing dehydrogenase